MEKPCFDCCWHRGVVIGAKFLVDSSVFFAKTFGISEAVIALSLVAVGTSLPELAVSSLASWKGDSGIAIGNIIGSNIFNVLLILGVCSLVTSLIINQKMFINMILACIVSLIILSMLYTGYVLSRKEGVVLLIGYACYIMWLYMV